MITETITIGAMIILGLIVLSAIKIVRPRERALVERMGHYTRHLGQGVHLVIPVFEKVYRINITEQMVDAKPQEIITKDNLNAGVDAQIYFKVKDDEQSLKNSQYNVDNYEYQIVNLARTTLRNVIGTMVFTEVNSERQRLNKFLEEILDKETNAWGIAIVRTELKEIQPPQDVQDTMNKVLKAENEKIAAKDLATATETEADGFRRAEIKKADGEAKAIRLVADAKAEAIKLVSNSANKHFIGNAQLQRKLEVAENALKDNTKYIIPQGQPLTLVISENKDIIPISSEMYEKEER